MTADLLVLLLATATVPTPDDVRAVYHREHAARLVPLLLEAVRFPTVEGNVQARSAQQAWLARVAGERGLVVRDAGLVTEVELPGPPGAPVLGLVVHGDVQPVAEAEWSVPPFAGVERGGFVWGRGSADDKGPLVQALLALAALKDSRFPLTHTIRLLVGSDEESGNEDIASYLKGHQPPALSLVLDSQFPVVVGEKAWNALTVTVEDPYVARTGVDAGPWSVAALDAGLATPIVPSRAVATLRFGGETETGFDAAVARLAAGEGPEGLSLVTEARGRTLTLTAKGRAAHAGMNLEAGRNALVFLARTLAGQLAPSGAADLLAFAVEAGQDLYGSGLGLTAGDPLWGRFAVNVATIKATDRGGLALTINVRRPPPLTGPELREHLERRVADFNARRGSHLDPSGFYDDEPLVFDPEARLVKRLLAAYARATGHRERPAISGGGSYAKRLPRSIAFGMWFPGKPYPGHDVDERVTAEDLQRGVDVLLETLCDLAGSRPLTDPFGR